MKLIYKLIFLGLVGLIALPMFITGSDGEPMMTIDDWTPGVDSLKGQIESFGGLASDKVNSLGADVADGFSSITTDAAGGRDFYKWKDSDGVWQYSDKQNPQGTSETVYVRPDTNVVSSEGYQSAPIKKKATKKNIDIKQPNPLTAMGQVPKLMDDIKDVQKQADDRSGYFKGL